MKKILVVDDDEAILEIVQYLLQSGGYDVKTHSSGFKVLENVKLHKPDLVLLDIRLPGSLGTTVCRAIKQLYKIPVILFSADPKFNESFKDFDADAFIEKPFDIKDLLNKIESYLK